MHYLCKLKKDIYIFNSLLITNSYAKKPFR